MGDADDQLQGNSIPDITFATEGAYGRISEWRVMDGYNGSDHNYIALRVLEGASQ